jgi:hypothetical protein
MFGEFDEISELPSSNVRQQPATVAERPNVCTVFAHSEAGIVGLNPTQGGMDVWCLYMCVRFSVFMYR